jgi:hypothetical protein
MNVNESLSSQDRTRGLAEEGTTSRATARHSVLIEPHGAIPLILPPPAVYTLRGTTANFEVAFDASLRSEGEALADAILAHCEQDLSQLRSLFGGVSASRFSIFIDPGTFGAYHSTCLSTQIHCAAFTGMDGDLENFLACAEVDEVLMAVQANGWSCGSSNGEGLSRVLATELHPASLGRFASAARWLNSPQRPDWVSQTEATDRNYVSIGCATLFINYLRHQLRFSLAQIVQAGGSTLQQTYQRLTGSMDAFGPFASLLEARFPIGVPVDLPNDNPFPLSEVPDVMFEPARLAGKDVLLSGLVPKFSGAGQLNSFVNSQSPVAGKVVAGGSIVNMHLVQGEPP